MIRTGPVTPDEVAASPHRDAVTTHQEFVNPTRARQILEVYRWDKQRVVDRKHVAYLIDAIKRRELTHIELTFGVLPHGYMYLIDGYHRLEALSRTTLSLPVMHKKYPVKDEVELSRLYMSLDRPKLRSTNVMLRASGVEEHTTLNSREIGLLGAAVMFAESGFHSTFRSEKSLILRAERTKAWLPEGEMVRRWLMGASSEVRRLLERQPVMAVMLITARQQPEKAYEFWRGIALEVGLERDDPRFRLLTWLRANPRINHIGGVYKYAKYVAVAWNAFMDGRTMQYVRSQDGPIKLRGVTISRPDNDESSDVDDD